MSNSSSGPRGAVLMARKGLRCASASLTASSQQQAVTDFAVDMTLTSKKLKQAIDDSFVVEKELTISNAIEQLVACKAPLSVLRSRVPSIHQFVTYLLQVVDQVASYRQHMEAQLGAARTNLRAVNDVVRSEIDAASLRCGEEVRSMVSALSTREHEINTTQSLNIVLARKARELEEENVQLRERVATLERKQDVYEEASTAHRAQMADFQHKANLTIQENQYLRSICRHNRDLLQEIEDLKEDQEKVIRKLTEDKLQAVRAREVYENEAENSVNALQQLSSTISALHAEISQLKYALSASDDRCNRLQMERDLSLGVMTPRPSALSDKATKDAISKATAALKLETSRPVEGGRTDAICVHLVDLLNQDNGLTCLHDRAVHQASSSAPLPVGRYV
jgi:chromosome segregation ATPase